MSGRCTNGGWVGKPGNPSGRFWGFKLDVDTMQALERMKEHYERIEEDLASMVPEWSSWRLLAKWLGTP